MFAHELEKKKKTKKTKKKKTTLTEAVFALTNHIAWLPKWMTREEQNDSEIESDGQAQDHR